MQVFSICMNCRYFDPSEKTFNKCKAFSGPPGIPWLIISGENNHSKVLPGQEGNFIFNAK